MRYLFVFLTLAGALALVAFPAHAKSKKRSSYNPLYASIVMDADTGLILSQSSADKPLHPASLTKVMTLLLVFEALERGEMRLDDPVRISAHAASMPPSKIGLKAGSTIRLKDAILALVTKSANDISAALAEHAAGSEARFAALMTARAQDLGMNQTNFRNASGLHDPRQVSSARDMARLARYVIKRYPQYYTYFSTKTFTYRGATHANHNRLMQSYRGMDGMKTGYIGPSGFNLVASAVRNNRRLIGVVFGGRSAATRNSHMASLLDQSFAKLGKGEAPQVMAEVAPLRTVSMPVPKAKPLDALPPGTSFTSLSAIGTGTKIVAAATQQKSAAVEDAEVANIPPGYLGKLVGEGDYDPAVTKRIETGLLAINAHKGEYRPDPTPETALENTFREAGHAVVSKMAAGARTPERPAHPSVPDDSRQASLAPGAGTEDSHDWSIQIGAYGSRAATDDVLRAAMRKLPADLAALAHPIIVPLQADDGVVFRARLGGLNRSGAAKACRFFKDCIAVAPVRAAL